MGGSAVELFVQRALLMQNAIENIRGDPPRRETGDLGWQCEFLRRHGVGTFSASWTAQVFTHTIARKSALLPEYANCKNRPTGFVLAAPSLAGVLNPPGRTSGRNREMTENRSRSPAPAATEERKPLTPAARRALAEAEARRQAAEANAKAAPKEVQGPKGAEPTRYGDWENKGIASDF